MKLKTLLHKISPIKYFDMGRKIFNNPHFAEVQKLNTLEKEKSPLRTDVINFLLSQNPNNTHYLEIGVRNPADNYSHIIANKKFSVDPGIEFKENPADFKMTSDEFFQKLSENELLSNDIKFDVIFIDGLHLAHQVNKDIENALNFLKDDGFIVLHDCNPPTEWHARESQRYKYTPARNLWNGTTWKAFLKWRFNPSIYSCCIDSDWGVGVLCKTYQIGKNIEHTNPFFEFSSFDAHRKKYLNLIDFESFKNIIQNQNKDTT